MKNRKCTNHDSEYIIFSGKRDSFKIKEVSPTVVKRGKRYTCSGAGNHGELIRNFQVSGDLMSGFEEICRNFQSEMCHGCDENDTKLYKVSIAYAYTNNHNKLFVGIYFVPSFCDDKEFKYDEFIELINDKRLSDISLSRYSGRNF